MVWKIFLERVGIRNLHAVSLFIPFPHMYVTVCFGIRGFGRHSDVFGLSLFIT